ncbi:MAG TPA: serine/threonine-protein kinase [Kofleriaceae bacterium]
MPAVGEVATSRPTRLGRYELITRIGQGGMAEVQLALQRGPAGFEKLVVVKLVHNNLASQKAFVDMLLDEARVAALVKHPNVVDIYDLGQADGRYFIAMEYLEGEPLLAVLRAGREGKRLDPLSTGRLIADTAEGLDAAHELRSMAGDRLELVHHDISLGNIVVLYNGQVKLVDFGVAKATQTAAGPRAKVQGKFSYMAPEKLKGAAGDRRSDIFSLGCVMWEALTLKRLFRGGNDAETMKQVLETAIQPPSKVNGDVPPEYDVIVMRALDRDPNRRHGTAKEMAVEIEELLRKRGYGAKNDKIARYMQDTFRAHIDARKKLVQEVVNKGSASAEVLDAAFSDPVLATGSPSTPVGASDFSVKYERVTPVPQAVPIPTAAWADSSPRTMVSAPPFHPMFDGGSNTATEIGPLPDMSGVMDDPEVEVTRHGVPLAQRVRALADRAVTQARAILADKRKRLYVALGAGALVLLIIIIAIARSGSDKQAVAAGSASETEHAIAEPHGSDQVEPANHRPGVEYSDEHDDPSDIVIDTPTDPTVAKPDKTPKPDKVEKVEKVEKHDKVDRHEKVEKVEKVERPPPPPPPPAIDVTDTVNKGLKAFVTGDSKGALTLLNQAKAAKPGYAPTYRVLGKVQKKLGNNAAAKVAYQRYLKLAPTAPDADQIRKELEEL